VTGREVRGSPKDPLNYKNIESKKSGKPNTTYSCMTYVKSELMWLHCERYPNQTKPPGLHISIDLLWVRIASFPFVRL